MRKLGLLLAGLAFVLAGCGGTTNPSSGATDIVPSTAALFVAIDSDPSSSQWQTLDALASKFPDKQKAVDSAKQQLAKKGLDWERDLKPALGPELDVVMLDFAHPNDSVALMQPKDQGAFERAVKKGNATDPLNALVYEKFHGWTVISDKQSAIDAFKSASDTAKSTLTENKAFTAAMSKAGDGLVRAYVNGASVLSAAQQALGPDASTSFKQLGTLDWLLLSVRAKSDGIAWDTTVHGTPGKAFDQVSARSSDGSLRRFVPKDALLYLAFHGSKGMLGGLGQNPILQQPGFKGLGAALQQLGPADRGRERVLCARRGSEHGSRGDVHRGACRRCRRRGHTRPRVEALRSPARQADAGDDRRSAGPGVRGRACRRSLRERQGQARCQRHAVRYLLCPERRPGAFRQSGVPGLRLRARACRTSRRSCSTSTFTARSRSSSGSGSRTSPRQWPGI